TIEEHTDDKTTTEQEEVDEDLEEMTISHPTEDDQRDDVMKFTYNGVQITKSTGILDKKNDEVRELASKLKDDGLVQDVGKEHHQEKVTDRPEDILTNDKAEGSLDEKMCLSRKEKSTV
ncbi:9578_t:CDS:2, partial [Acaulospora morrowiae]